MLITERKVGSESGAILILTAILATIILIFVAIVVDLSIFSNSQEQTQHYSRLAVLAALEQHFAETVGTSQERAVKAMARAREVTGRNFMLSEPSRAAGLRSQGTSASDPGAVLLPGQYFFERPCNDPHDNTCNPCNGVYPCFVETDLTSDPDGPVTAYRVRGHLYDGIPTRFARTLFGTDTFPVEVFSTASVRPRQVIFLIDTSGSMTRETHFRRDPVLTQAENPPLGHGSYFSFVTSADNSTEPPRQDSHWTFLTSQLNRPRTGAEWSAFLGAATPPTSVANITESQYRLMHFKNDYKQIETLSDNDYASLSTEQKELFYNPNEAANYKFKVGASLLTHTDVYRADVGDDPTFSNYRYGGAEPLRTVFAGLNAAVQFFSARNVAGDKMGILFYNSTTPWSAFVKLTDNFDALEDITNFSDDSSLQDNNIFGDINVAGRLASGSTTGFKGGAKGAELAYRLRMLPLGKAAGFTNSLLALTVGLNELERANPNGGFATNAVVMIGDGLNNCVQCPASLPAVLPIEYAGCTAPGAFNCSNRFDVFDQTQKNLLGWITTNLANRNVPVHQILVGGAVAPHLLNVKKADGSCLSEKEARQANLPMVRGGFNHDGENVASCKNACSVAPGHTAPGPNCEKCRAAFQQAAADKPFYEANAYAYEVAVGTKGLWGPIRPKSTSCPNYTVDCSSAPDEADHERDSSLASAQTFDPDCRTPEEQINNYMADIIGGNPFAIVEVDHAVN